MRIHNLQAQAHDTVIITACYHEKTNAFYAMSNGGLFSGVNLDNEKVCEIFLEDTSATWAHDIYADFVYGVSLRQEGAGFLWVYDTNNKSLNRLADLPQGHQAWSLAVKDNENIFIGSYKEQDAHVFKYDGHTLQTVHTFKNQFSYIRSLAVSEQFLYIGTGQNGRIFAYDLENEGIEEITQNLPELLNKPASSFSFAYDMFYHDHHLFCRIDQSHTDAFSIYNTKSKKWTVIENKKSSMFKQLPFDDTGIYAILDKSWHHIDYKNNIVTDLKLNYDFDPRGGIYKKNKIYTLGRNGQLVSFDLKGKEIENRETVMGQLPLTLHNLASDSLGNVYISSYPGGPKLIQRKNDEIKEIPFPQVEGFADDKSNKMYLGVYPGARVFELNRDSLKYRELFNLKDKYKQDRPYIMEYKDDLLMIGTIPDYKERGGVFAIYDPKTQSKKVYEELIKDQSIISIEKEDQIVYLSSTIRGGLDSVWTNAKPQVIKFNLETEAIEVQTELTLKGFSGKIMISALRLHHDTLWCVSDGCLFGLDKNTLQIKESLIVYDDVKDFGMWNPNKLILYKGNRFITDLAGGINIVDLKTKEIEELVSKDQGVSFITFTDNKIYFLDKEDKELKVIELKFNI